MQLIMNDTNGNIEKQEIRILPNTEITIHSTLSKLFDFVFDFDYEQQL